MRTPRSSVPTACMPVSGSRFSSEDNIRFSQTMIAFHLVSKQSLTEEEKHLLTWLLNPHSFEVLQKETQKSVIESRAKELILFSVIELCGMIHVLQEKYPYKPQELSAALDELKTCFIEEKLEDAKKFPHLDEAQTQQSRDCRFALIEHFGNWTKESRLSETERKNLEKSYLSWFQNTIEAFLTAAKTYLNSSPLPLSFDVADTPIGTFRSTVKILESRVKRFRSGAEFALDGVNQETEEQVLRLADIDGTVAALTPLQGFTVRRRSRVLNGGVDLQAKNQNEKTLLECAQKADNQEAIQIIQELLGLQRSKAKSALFYVSPVAALLIEAGIVTDIIDPSLFHEKTSFILQHIHSSPAMIIGFSAAVLFIITLLVMLLVKGCKKNAPINPEQSDEVAVPRAKRQLRFS